jgi:hypothetical protein
LAALRASALNRTAGFFGLAHLRATGELEHLRWLLGWLAAHQVVLAGRNLGQLALRIDLASSRSFRISWIVIADTGLAGVRVSAPAVHGQATELWRKEGRTGPGETDQGGTLPSSRLVIFDLVGISPPRPPCGGPLCSSTFESLARMDDPVPVERGPAHHGTPFVRKSGSGRCTGSLLENLGPGPTWQTAGHSSRRLRRGRQVVSSCHWRGSA